MMIRGLNHMTLAVADLERSLRFYRDLLGIPVRAVWPEGAYLEAGALWLCLSVDQKAAFRPAPDYTHFAFDVEEDHFETLNKRVSEAAPLWRENRSEGASLYVLDPDGHKVEFHVGSLASRLAHYRASSPPGMTIFEGGR